MDFLYSTNIEDIRTGLEDAATRLFEQWMNKVDAILADNFDGMISTDFADRRWRDDFDSELQPLEAITEAYGDPSDIESMRAAVMS